MNVRLNHRNECAYIDMSQSDFILDGESTLNDLISLCYEHQSNCMLLDTHNFSAGFFDLKSGLAGTTLQKFANYQMKVAIILKPERAHNKRFKELIYEMNQSTHFRFYDHREDAEVWLTT